MEDTKKWHQSKTIWGGILMILGLVLAPLGVELSEAMQADLVNQIISAISAVMELAGSILAIYGRVKAKKAIQ